jgi:large subunit ribosomal protein L23
MTISAAKQERLTRILLSPLESEKTSRVGDKHNQVVFKVLRDADKQEIKAAVEFLFKVEVSSVQVLNVKGKQKTFGKIRGKRSDWKKAYVALKPGHDINFAAA